MDPEHTSEVATHETHHANSKDAVVNVTPYFIYLII